MNMFYNRIADKFALGAHVEKSLGYSFIGNKVYVPRVECVTDEIKAIFL